MDEDDTQAAWAQVELEKRRQEEEAWQQHCQLVKDFTRTNREYEQDMRRIKCRR